MTNLIGRDSLSKDYPQDQFHLLDVRHSFPYWTLDFKSSIATAIDEDGEIWILSATYDCSYATAFCGESVRKSVSEPKKTILMETYLPGYRAVSLQADENMICATYITAGDPASQKVKLFHAEDTHESLQNRIHTLIHTNVHQLRDFYEVKSKLVKYQYYSHSFKGILASFYIKQKKSKDKEYPTLVFDITKDVLEFQTVEKQDDIENYKFIERQAMLLDYWQSQVSNQLNKKSEKVFEYIKENYSNSKFVIDFYKKFTRLPSVKPTFMKKISDTEY